MAGVEVRIGANTEELDAAVRRSQSQLKQLSSEMKTGITQAAKYGAAAAAAGAAVAIGLTIKGLAAVDAQAKLAKQLNTTSSSMATIARAGELSGISIEKINASATRLTRRLSLAEAGAGPAAEAIKRLGLNAAEVARLPLDERIATVNTAINEMIPAAQQAGVATQLFGEEAGIAMRSLDPAVMAQAAHEAELFGTAISDVDAAQVEAANDAMSTISTAIEGVSKRLAIEMAPIIQAVSKMFVDAAEEAGGFGEATSDAFGFVVESAAFVMDAVDGIKRVFEIVADGIIAAWNKMASLVAVQIENIVELVDAIPGVDMSESLESIRNFGKQAESVAGLAVENIQATLNRPLAGNQFKEFVAQAREQAEIVAEENLNLADQLIGSPEQITAKSESAREALAEEDEKTLEQRKKFASRMDALENQSAARQEKTVEMSSKEKRNAISGALGDVTTLMNSESRKQFEIGKAAALAQAVVDGYAAITGAYKVGAGIGGPPVGAAFAAAAGAATFAQINAIRSQSFGGGGGGSNGSGSVTQGINNQGEGVRGQAQQGQTLTLQGVDPNSLFTGRQLIDTINQAQKDGAILQVQQ